MGLSPSGGFTPIRIMLSAGFAADQRNALDFLDTTSRSPLFCAVVGDLQGTVSLMNRESCLQRLRWISILPGTILGLSVLLSQNAVHADTFGSGANSFDIEFVTIGNPGNPPDANPNPAGAVPYATALASMKSPSR